MAFAEELSLVPQVFDDLEVHDDVDGPVREGEFGEVAVPHVDAWVAGADVSDCALVVVEADDPRCHVGDHVRAVAFARSCFEDGPVPAAVEQSPVDHFVAPEPVVLLGDAGYRPFAGEGQSLGVVGAAVGIAHRADISATALRLRSGGPDHRFARPFVRLW